MVWIHKYCQKNRVNTIFKILWSLSLIMQWWSLTKFNVVAKCFTFNFLHFSLLKHDLFLLFFILICYVNSWWMQGLQFFFILANGFKVYVFCVLSYLFCVALLPSWNQNIYVVYCALHFCWIRIGSKIWVIFLCCTCQMKFRCLFAYVLCIIFCWIKSFFIFML
jgi:hypothetical protein